MTRKRLLLALVIAAAPTSGASAHAATTRTVTLRHIAFSPERLTIARGDAVRFLWRDGDVSHNVTSTGKLRFRSVGNRKTGSATVRFTNAGTYGYRCTLHYGMNGRIRVRRTCADRPLGPCGRPNASGASGSRCGDLARSNSPASQ